MTTVPADPQALLRDFRQTQSYFIGIDSETDSLPIGESRVHWAADALAKKWGRSPQGASASNVEPGRRWSNS